MTSSGLFGFLRNFREDLSFCRQHRPTLRRRRGGRYPAEARRTSPRDERASFSVENVFLVISFCRLLFFFSISRLSIAVFRDSSTSRLEACSTAIVSERETPLPVVFVCVRVSATNSLMAFDVRARVSEQATSSAEDSRLGPIPPLPSTPFGSPRRADC